MKLRRAFCLEIYVVEISFVANEKPPKADFLATNSLAYLEFSVKRISSHKYRV